MCLYEKIITLNNSANRDFFVSQFIEVVSTATEKFILRCSKDKDAYRAEDRIKRKHYFDVNKIYVI